MEPDDKDIMYRLFAGMTDESLPVGFNEKAMERIRHEVLLRENRKKRWEMFGYFSGFVAAIAACVVVLYNMGISFKVPEFEWFAWTFPKFDSNILKFDYSIFTSQSFMLSVYIGILALFLIIVDFAIRRHIEKTRPK